MKKVKFYLFVFCALSLISCDEDIIDLTERDSLPTEIAVADLAGLEISMLDVYVQAKSLHESNGLSMYKQCGTDIVTSGTNMIDNFNNDGGGMYEFMEYPTALDPTMQPLQNLFNGLYLSLDRCNVVLSFANNYIPVDADEEQRLNTVIGEAYTLRAYVYLELAERWDNVVFSELAQTVDDIKFTAELNSRDEVMQQVIDDATAAVPLLGTRLENGDVGKPSKDMAYLLLAKAHMWLENYEEAAEAAENVIAQGAQLQPLNGIFGLEGGKTGEENNQEIIFSWIFNPSDRNRPQRTVQMMVPLYDRVPGVSRTLEQGARPWGRIIPSDYYWTLFEEGDGRLEAWHQTGWVLDDPDEIMEGFGLEEGDIATEEYVVAWADGNVNAERYLEPTSTKNWEDGTYGRTDADAEGFRNVIVYRLAEAYIIGAEAHWRNNNTPRALTLINTIRERAFGDASHNFLTLDEETFIEEHARELGHEGHRWTFLKRIGKLVERVKLHNPSAAPNIKDYHVRLPIPQNFVSQLGIDQNPGY